MKLEVGMYVRTEDGFIGKYLGNYAKKTPWLYYFDNSIITDYDCECGEYKTNYLYELETSEQIIKTSYNIIDLIEVGDYVNGFKIDGVGLRDVVSQGSILSKNNIKSIVTKEQFDSVKYEVKGE